MRPSKGHSSTGGRNRDTSTDSIELAGLDDSGHTQSYESANLPPSERRAQKGEVEANIILIAHPDNRMLGTRFRLSPGATIEIGRSPSAEISLPEVLSISRSHARLQYLDNQVMIEDLQSTNGTFVNDQPIKARSTLKSGDRFQVGAVHFKFMHELDPEHAYHEAIYHLVMRDGLTEIYNKRKYEEEAQREVPRSVRHQRPLALVMFDIDQFKNVNDSYGHLCGDFVLKQIAELTRELLRPEQVFARVGGEEFVILSPEMDIEGARAMAEKMRERLQEHEFVYAGFKVPVTCSFGVAAVSADITSPERLYEAADRALYMAKKNGRNRVEVYEQQV